MLALVMWLTLGAVNMLLQTALPPISTFKSTILRRVYLVSFLVVSPPAFLLVLALAALMDAVERRDFSLGYKDFITSVVEVSQNVKGAWYGR